MEQILYFTVKCSEFKIRKLNVVIQSIVNQTYINKSMSNKPYKTFQIELSVFRRSVK